MRTAFPLSWRTSDQTTTTSNATSTGPIHALAYSASQSKYILSGSADRTIRLYNPSVTTTTPAYPNSSNSITTPGTTSDPSGAAIPTGRLIQSYQGHGYAVLSLAVAASNDVFASSGGDRAVLVWDVATATTLRRLGAQSGPPHGHAARVNAVAFAGQADSLLVSAGLDATVKFWDLRSSSSARPVQTLVDAADAVTCLAVLPTGAEVMAGSVDGRVRCYDVRMGRCVVDCVGPAVTSLCPTRDGGAVLVGALDSAVRLMDRRDGACLRRYADEAGGWRNESIRVQSVLGGGEKWVVAGDEAVAGQTNPGEAKYHGYEAGGRVVAWDLVTGEVTARIPVPGQRRGSTRDATKENVVSCLAWKEGGWGDQFCVGGTSGIVTVFGS